MFTTVAFGLCAFVVEAAGQIEIGVARYPAVAVGIVATDNCRVRLVLPEGMSTPLLMTNGLFPYVPSRKNLGRVMDRQQSVVQYP
jgi:hypothetical protein